TTRIRVMGDISSLYLGKRNRGRSFRPVRPFQLTGKLIDQGLHYLLADAGPVWPALGREADAVIGNNQVKLLLASAYLDVRLPRSSLRKAIFESIAHQFVHDEGTGDELVDVQKLRLLHPNPWGYNAGLWAVTTEQVLNQVAQVRAQINPGQVR